VRLDYAKNDSIHGTEAVISTLDSPVTVCVIPTDEELMIALDTLQLI
jgi:acetate kinase